MKKILVTGATGFLGCCLLDELTSAKDISIRILKHKRSPQSDNCEIVTGDLMDYKSLLPVVSEVDTVVHLAAITHTNHESDYFKINSEGTRNLVQACEDKKVRRFVFVSSRAAHPDGGGYAQSKLEAEGFLKASTIDWLILRPAEVFGPHSSDAINQLIGWIQKLKLAPIIGDGRYKLSPVYIDDLLPAFVKAVMDDSIINKTLILGGPENITYLSLIDRLAKCLKTKCIKIPIPVFFMKFMVNALLAIGINILYRDQIPRLLCEKESDITESVNLLDYRPRNLEEGLQEYLHKPRASRS
jgi:nucleoside-diphosphate-sugar epimerase